MWAVGLYAEKSEPELLAVLRKIEPRGAIETAHRARGSQHGVSIRHHRGQG
ncbi:phage integrase central domain-containing protein [Xanthomonas hortorum]|uniref:phage integrase central domain-containing protein n=1 Tax=Xanthomonas hortorum TaxID=56454 RepID=UPI003D004EFE